jgi:hypothetical protein
VFCALTVETGHSVAAAVMASRISLVFI